MLQPLAITQKKGVVNCWHQVQSPFFSRLLSSLQPTDRWGVKFNDLVLKRQSGWAGHFAARKRHNPLTWYLIDFLLFVESSSGY